MKKYQECYDNSAAIAIWLNAVAALRNPKRWGYVCSVSEASRDPNVFNAMLSDVYNRLFSLIQLQSIAIFHQKIET